MRRLDPPEGLLLRDDARLDHVDRDPHGGRRGALRRARLEHVEAATLDRELEVLDVAVVALEPLGDPLELVVRAGQLARELGDLLRRPNAGDDVLALRVREVLAEQLAVTGVRVAGEGDPRAGVVAHVAEDHRHDVDGRAEVVGDLVVVAVVAGTLAEPAREHCLDRKVELLVGIGREVAAGLPADDRLELVGDLAERGGVEVRVLLGATGMLGGLERLVELRAIDAHDDPAEHLDEAAVRVPPEALVAGERDEPLQGPLVEPQVEDRVHHPGHRELRAGADGHQQGVRRVAEPLAGSLLHLVHRLEDVVPEPLGQLLPGREVVVTRGGRDREPRRDRETRVRHLGESGALPPEEVLHLPVALGMAVAPRVDVALLGAVGAGWRGGGTGHRRRTPRARAAAPKRRPGRGSASRSATIGRL